MRRMNEAKRAMQKKGRVVIEARQAIIVHAVLEKKETGEITEEESEKEKEKKGEVNEWS